MRQTSLYNYALIFLLFLTFLGFAWLDSYAQEPGAISGIVTDEAGTPLEELVIRAEVIDPENNEQWNEVGVTQTDSEGRYTLCCLSEDDYRISFLDPGARYITEFYDDVLPPEAFGPETVAMVHVTAALTTTAINAKLAQYSVLTGAVTDPSAQPLAQINVDLYRYDRIGNDWKKLDPLQTNASGVYRSQLLPGRYRLHFTDPQSEPTYISEYYQDAANFASAQEITITKEITVTANAILDPAATISGTLTNHNAETAAGVTVELYQFEGGVGWVPIINTVSDDGGNYRLSGLRSGVYRLYFTDERATPLYDSEYYDNADTIANAADITVATGETVANINADGFNRLEPLTTSTQQVATVRISGPTDDADNDTIPDNIEGAADPDHDNIPNFRDLDADNDTIPDQEEVGADPTKPQDSNNDGIPDYLDNAPQLPTVYSLWLPVVQR